MWAWLKSLFVDGDGVVPWACVSEKGNYYKHCEHISTDYAVIPPCHEPVLAHVHTCCHCGRARVTKWDW